MPTVHTSACPLDCPDLCGLRVEVEAGRVTKVDGDHRNPITDGFICGKVRNIAEQMSGEHRILTPLDRVGAKGEGRFAPISWDDALDRIATRLAAIRAEHGGEAILPYHYGGSNGWLTEGGATTRLFRRLGASQCVRTLCAAPSTAAVRGMYGKVPGVALEDYPAARLIVVWGANPSASGIHLVPIIERAVEAGATLVVVDPRRTPLARRAALHLRVRPGTDLPVALAIITELFARGAADHEFLAKHTRGADELRRRAAPWTLARAAAESGCPVADLERFVELYVATNPAVIRVGWGLERNRNGGSAVAAVLALPAIAGKFGVRGGGYTMSNGDAAWGVDAEAGIAEPVPTTRAISMAVLGEALASAEPPVRALFVYNCNPTQTVPDQRAVERGLARDDLFTVVHEQVMTDTCRFADVVLPATAFLEHRDLRRGLHQEPSAEQIRAARAGRARRLARSGGRARSGAGVRPAARGAADRTGARARDRWARSQVSRRAGVARCRGPDRTGGRRRARAQRRGGQESLAPRASRRAGAHGARARRSLAGVGDRRPRLPRRARDVHPSPRGRRQRRGVRRDGAAPGRVFALPRRLRIVAHRARSLSGDDGRGAAGGATLGAARDPRSARELNPSRACRLSPGMQSKTSAAATVVVTERNFELVSKS